MNVRPTSDRLRETLFNVIAPRIEEARFLDLCAGSGAVGIEALSRGAAGVTFVEQGAVALGVLQKNLAALGIRGGVTVERRSVGAFLKRESRVFDTVFLDPPYAEAEEYLRTLGMLGGERAGLLAEGALVVAEHRKKDSLAEGYGGLVRTRVLVQGDAGLSFYEVQKRV